VPFHQWTPDVYEGAPSSVTAYMSVTVKAAAFVTLLRILVVAFQPQAGELSDLLWGLAALTMIVGNVMAVIQDNVKRLLAYSSVAHAGYLLLGIVAGSQEGYSAVLFYLVCYVFVNLGAFAVIVSLANQARDCERIEEFAGLAKTRPALAALMTLFMVALAGIPGTAGFTAKLFLFIAAVKAGYVWLTVIAVLASAVSVYYYLRIPVVMWMREPSEEGHRLRIDTGEGLVLGICGFFAIYLGLFPNQGWLPVLGEIHVLDWARLAVAFLF
jgi:NADH-quinone oxidoreductase subunit N